MFRLKTKPRVVEHYPGKFCIMRGNKFYRRYANPGDAWTKSWLLDPYEFHSREEATAFMNKLIKDGLA